jgi:hypothetical protein
MTATVKAPTSSRKNAEGTVLVASLVVAAVWAYRKLIEGSSVASKTNEPALRKVIGLEAKPANTAQFAVAFGFTFFTLSIGAMAAPELASAMAILIATGDVLANGASVFTDISAQVSEKTKPPAPTPAPAARTVRK